MDVATRSGSCVLANVAVTIDALRRQQQKTSGPAVANSALRGQLFALQKAFQEGRDMEARNLSVPKLNTPFTRHSLVLGLSQFFGLSMHAFTFLLSLAVIASATVLTHAQSPIRFPSFASHQTPRVTATTVRRRSATHLLRLDRGT